MVGAKLSALGLCLVEQIKTVDVQNQKAERTTKECNKHDPAEQLRRTAKRDIYIPRTPAVSFSTQSFIPWPLRTPPLSFLPSTPYPLLPGNANTVVSKA